MSDRSEGDADVMRRVIAATPVGRQELREPLSGLSLPQRWLLGHLDGESSLARLAALPGSPPAQRLPRDAARLVGLGLAVDVGDPGPEASSFGPTTTYGEISLPLPLGEAEGHAPGAAWSPKRGGVSGPRAGVLAGALLLGGGGAVAWVFTGSGSAQPPVVAAPAAPASSAAAAAAPPLAPAPAPAASARPDKLGLTIDTVLAALTVTPRSTAPAAPPVEPAPRGVAADPALAARPAASIVPVTRAATAAATPVPLVAAPPPAAQPQAQVAAPSPPPAPTVAAPSVAPPQAASPPAAQPVTPAPQVPAPAPQVAAPAPQAASPVQRLAAAPSVMPAPAAPAPLRPVSIVEPAFPREGYGLGGRAVLLQARVTVAPNGTVSEVSFPVSSSTTRPFERAARSALLQWRFPEGTGERVIQQQIRFSEE